MAKRLVVELVDDLSGQPGATTTRFGLDGVDFEIDLVDDRQLRDLLAPYIARGRRIGKTAEPGRVNGATRRHDMHLIRRWAHDNGIRVPARGRMPAATIRAYDEHIRTQASRNHNGQPH
jgi:Lsr2